jgi:hypothetical protein
MAARRVYHVANIVYSDDVVVVVMLLRSNGWRRLTCDANICGGSTLPRRDLSRYP